MMSYDQWLRLLKEARAKKATGKDASDTAEDDLLHEATSEHEGFLTT